ncbi:hypothetical protein PoB_005686600 [Plakobranchus ocellatus]|uniref:Uncharacterized protein n=1 Tax=Plakobranchus ocellatus TaxID=259542 RepID=A0AAV4CG59_9GAST|nr:hypothetical protein PoB_005686600 [Plakobranchus ocellatus]
MPNTCTCTWYLFKSKEGEVVNPIRPLFNRLIPPLPSILKTEQCSLPEMPGSKTPLHMSHEFSDLVLPHQKGVILGSFTDQDPTKIILGVLVTEYLLSCESFKSETEGSPIRVPCIYQAFGGWMKRLPLTGSWSK